MEYDKEKHPLQKIQGYIISSNKETRKRNFLIRPDTLNTIKTNYIV